MAMRPGRTKMAVETISLKTGDEAPDFTLTTHLGERKGARSNATFTLSQLRGQKNVVIAFFPLAYTPA